MDSNQVWVFETNNPSANETYVHLYEDETDALIVAIDAAIDHMEYLDCDKSSAPESWAEAYQEVKDYKKDAKYRLALETHRDWVCNLDCYEDVFNVYVYSRNINAKSRSTESEPGIFPVTKEELSEIKDVSKKHVPCKFCGTSLFEGESPCWRCETVDPTKGE